MANTTCLQGNNLNATHLGIILEGLNKYFHIFICCQMFPNLFDENNDDVRATYQDPTF